MTLRGDARMSATRRMPRFSSDSAAFGPTPQSAETGSAARNEAVSGALTISIPSGFARVEAISSPEARAAWNRDNISRGLAAVEKLLDHPATGRFCHGDAPGYADCVLVPQLYNARRWEVRFDHLPRIAAVAERCAGLPAFQKAHPEHQPSPAPALEAGG